MSNDMALTGLVVVGWGNHDIQGIHLNEEEKFTYEEEKLHLSGSDKAYCFNLERTDKVQTPNNLAI